MWEQERKREEGDEREIGYGPNAKKTGKREKREGGAPRRYLTQASSFGRSPPGCASQLVARPHSVAVSLPSAAPATSHTPSQHTHTRYCAHFFATHATAVQGYFQDSLMLPAAPAVLLATGPLNVAEVVVGHTSYDGTVWLTDTMPPRHGGESAYEVR